MTNVIVVTHGNCGAEMIRAAREKVGTLDGVTAVGVSEGDSPEAVRRRIEAAVEALHADEVVYLVDLGGSTPFNLCCRRCGGRSAVVSGVNLAMLFKLATADRALPAMQLAAELAQSGAKSISVRGGDQ